MDIHVIQNNGFNNYTEYERNVRIAFCSVCVLTVGSCLHCMKPYLSHQSRKWKVLSIQGSILWLWSIFRQVIGVKILLVYMYFGFWILLGCVQKLDTFKAVQGLTLASWGVSRIFPLKSKISDKITPGALPLTLVYSIRRIFVE